MHLLNAMCWMNNRTSATILTYRWGFLDNHLRVSISYNFDRWCVIMSFIGFILQNIVSFSFCSHITTTFVRWHSNIGWAFACLSLNFIGWSLIILSSYQPLKTAKLIKWFLVNWPSNLAILKFSIINTYLLTLWCCFLFMIWMIVWAFARGAV